MEGENESDCSVGVAMGDSAPNIPPSPSPPPTVSAQLKSVLTDICYILSFPLILLVMIGCFCWFGANTIEVIRGRNDRGKKDDNGLPSDASGIYYKLYQTISPFKLRALTMTVTCRVGCLLVLWLAVSRSLPSFKTATFLGVIHWKWSLLATILSLGYPCFCIAAFGFVNVFGNKRVSRDNSAYSLVLGLLESLAVLIHVLIIFLVWMLSFHGHELGLAGTGVDYYTTRSLAALLVGAFLWLLKSAMLLRWEQVAIYTKFKARILMSGLRLYFLILIFHMEREGLLLPFWYDWKDDGWYAIDLDSLEPSFKTNFQQFILSSNRVSMHAIKVIARYLTTLTRFTSREDDDSLLFRIVDEYRQKIESQFRDSEQVPTTRDIIKFLFRNKEIRLLERELQEEYPSKEINQIPFDKWVGDAHKSCVSVAYSLVDAFAMVSVLNMILTSCLIVVVILLWLIITEIATTKVLVVIASPFLALTFVFGDTCKTFFQGFIFAFITHPFDIGDRCIIDAIEVEVKRVNIMTTTCLKIGTKEQMMYPNSMLATSLITNLGNKLDPTDVIELDLPSSTNMSTILELKENVNKFLDLDKQREFFEKSHRVVVKEMKNDIKIFIYFEHTMDGKDVSHSQFLIKKESQRSELFIEIKQFLEKLGVQVATS